MSKTICAISTPIGNGGISIVRISGTNAIEITNKITKKDISKFEARKLYLTKIFTENFNDNALVVVFKSPNSYTGEDMVEIQCHGGILIAKGILNSLLSNGAIMAENGEFTKRAFVNGKISLDKAEGVIDMINAESESSIKAGYNLLSGKLFEKINSLQSYLTDCLAEMEVILDYPEEDIDYINNNKINNNLDKTSKELEELLLTCKTGKQVKNGINVSILGKPNVGKSSLLNALLGYERAIVTNVAGTTRDTIEEKYNYKGITFNIVDTAGIRESNDTVESIGIKKAEDSLNYADIVLLVLDLNKNLENEDLKIIDLVKNKKVILVLNKTDLVQNLDLNSEKLQNFNEKVFVSAYNLDNINELKEKIYNNVVNKDILNSQILITNTRHENALRTSLNYINNAKELLKNQESLDLIILEVKSAWLELGKITGQTNNEEIINTIFSKFCLGK